MGRWRRALTPLLLALVLLAVCGLGRERVFLLMYHDFTLEEPSNDWTVSADWFRADLEWLTGHGYRFCLPGELMDGGRVPPKAVMLTFDDGYRSNYTLAYPILREFGAKAVISVVGKLVDQEAEGILTWEMCREMADSGLVEIGCHTYDCHREEQGILRLPGESREDYEARVFPDLRRCADAIEEHVGRPARFFAYPNGRSDRWAEGFVRENFGMTVTTRQGAAEVWRGFWDLGRYNVAPTVEPRGFLPG